MRKLKLSKDVEILLPQGTTSALVQQEGIAPFPPWNFQKHEILPNFAQKRHNLGHFYKRAVHKKEQWRQLLF